MAKNKHIEIDFLGSQEEKLTKKDHAEISEQIQLMKAARKNKKSRLKAAKKVSSSKTKEHA